MSIDLGNTPVGTPPTPTEQTQLRTSFGLGAADTVEFGGFVPPSGTTAEIDAVTTADIGQVMVDTDRKGLVSELNAMITTLDTLQGDIAGHTVTVGDLSSYTTY